MQHAGYLISIGVTAAGVYYKLNTTVQLQAAEIEVLKTQLSELKANVGKIDDRTDSIENGSAQVIKDLKRQIEGRRRPN
jgi:cell division protein FtsB